MASLFARCVPGSIDALEAAARGMMHAQLALGLLGTSAGFHGSGYLAGVVAMSALGLVAIETSTKALLKYTAATYWFTIWLDIIWLGVYLRDAIDETKWTNSIHRRGNEFACGMIVMICLLRIPQFFVWCKMWDLGFRSGAPQASRYVDFQANPAARTEFGSPPTPSGSAFAQPPRSPAPSSTPPPPRPVQSMVVSPTAVAPPAPLAPPAVVSFTPSGGDAYQPQ